MFHFQIIAYWWNTSRYNDFILIHKYKNSIFTYEPVKYNWIISNIFIFYYNNANHQLYYILVAPHQLLWSYLCSTFEVPVDSWKEIEWNL